MKKLEVVWDRKPQLHKHESKDTTEHIANSRAGHYHFASYPMLVFPSHRHGCFISIFTYNPRRPRMVVHPSGNSCSIIYLGLRTSANPDRLSSRSVWPEAIILYWHPGHNYPYFNLRVDIPILASPCQPDFVWFFPCSSFRTRDGIDNSMV